MNASTQPQGRRAGQDSKIVPKVKKAELLAPKTGRVSIPFQLDVRKPMEEWLRGEIKALTRRKKFSAYVRDGLRLMIDLSAGRTEVLCELFPWIEDRLHAAPAQPDLSVLLNQITQLQLQLQQVQHAPLAAPSMNTFMLPEPAVMEADTQTAATVNTGEDARKQFAASIMGYDDDDED